MSEQMNYRMSDNVEKLFEALGAAQQVMTGAVKDSVNPAFGGRSKYADLASCWEACRQPLAENGLAVLQPVSADGSKVTVSTILTHKSGQWIASDLTLTSTKADPQGIGSAITYGRRYGLSAMVGIAPEDDDGNAASGQDKPKPKAETKPAPTPIQQDVSPLMLNNIKAMKAEIGDKLYYATLEKHGVKTPGDLKSKGEEQARKLLSELGDVRKAVVSATEHGEVAKGMDELLFNSLPDAGRSKVFTELRNKIALACGSKDTATDEYERLRENCESQWELYRALDRAHEFYSTGKIAG